MCALADLISRVIYQWAAVPSAADPALDAARQRAPKWIFVQTAVKVAMEIHFYAVDGQFLLICFRLMDAMFIVYCWKYCEGGGEGGTKDPNGVILKIIYNGRVR